MPRLKNNKCLLLVNTIQTKEPEINWTDTSIYIETGDCEFSGGISYYYNTQDGLKKRWKKKLCNTKVSLRLHTISEIYHILLNLLNQKSVWLLQLIDATLRDMRNSKQTLMLQIIYIALKFWTKRWNAKIRKQKILGVLKDRSK